MKYLQFTQAMKISDNYEVSFEELQEIIDEEGLDLDINNINEEFIREILPYCSILNDSSEDESITNIKIV